MFVGVAADRVLETHQVHGGAFQLQLQHLAVQRRAQAGHAMLVGAEAAVLVLVLVSLGLGHG
ncbi:hypothetical protein D3C81_2038310 [compost metagenome]